MVPMEVVWPMRCREGGLCLAIFALVLFALSPMAPAADATQKNFASPEDGIAALVETVKLNEQAKLDAILGSHGTRLISSGDEVADRQSRERFLKAYDEANKRVLEGDTATLVIGKDEWPLPIPLVKIQGRWRFDALQGEEEILARRIGRNELSAIQVCLAIVDAQREFVAFDRDGDAILEYASKFVSTPGKHDGLYWETQLDEPPSPLGPLLVVATSEGYGSSDSQPLAPYHGYFYRILTTQGQDAQGGAYDYLIDGKMIGGFGVIAYPARYGASGIMSFIVNQDGVVYQKDLGKDTAAIAAQIAIFNPDASWKRP